MGELPTMPWQQLVSFPSQAYDVPSGTVGNNLFEKFSDELKGIVSRKWNLEQFLVFQVVFLQRNRNVKRSLNVQQRIAKRINAWEKGQITMQVLCR
jgi:hypothetical protein